MIDPITRADLTVVLMADVEDLLNLIKYGAEASRLIADIIALYREEGHTRVEVVEVDRYRIDAVHRAGRFMLRFTIGWDLIVKLIQC